MVNALFSTSQPLTADFVLDIAKQKPYHSHNMLSTLDCYVFSPTGSTQKVASTLASALAETVIAHDLGSKLPLAPAEAEYALIAAPVYAGRIPALVAEKVQQLAGAGKKVVTLVVYGNRAYEDALLELNDAATAAGFTVVASGAFVAEHSIHRAVAVGRPDAQDAAELQSFAASILAKLAQGELSPVSVPGNRPYKAGLSLPATPLFLPNCGGCGKCVRLCPTGAISRNAEGQLVTDAGKCILCMACVAACPRKARVLPPPLQAGMEQKLSALIPLRRANEQYL